METQVMAQETFDRSFDDPYLAIRQHSYADVLREHRRSRPHVIAAIDSGKSITFTELDQRVNRLVSSLRRRGIGQGDRLLWLGQNSFKVLELLLAAAKMGAVLCPANWRMTVNEIRRTVDDFDPKVIFWQEAETGEVHRKSRLGWQEGRLWIQHDGAEIDCFNDLIDEGEDEDPDLVIPSDAPLLAIYTSAFTGRPGAAMLSHNSLLLQALINARGQAVGEDTRYMVSGPMFHIGVLMGGLATFVCGGTCIFVARPDGAEMVRLIAEHRVTHAFVPQPLIAKMAETVTAEKLDVSSLFARPDLGDWEHPLVIPSDAPARRNRKTYGQTEISGTAIAGWLGGEGAGRPNPVTQVKLLDDEGKEVPPGAVGEICVRGPMVMNGYYNRPDENARRARHGWHQTNDLGRRLTDGSIVFVGPKTTMIKTGIENVYPTEVEACIRQLDQVADVCVIGVPDPVWDQNVKAVVVLKSGARLSAEEIIEQCRANIASYKKPKTVVFVDALPKDGNGQVSRDAVDAAHGGGGYPRIG
jgi:long-chain acyl-CoA synthetase